MVAANDNEFLNPPFVMRLNMVRLMLYEFPAFFFPELSLILDEDEDELKRIALDIVCCTVCRLSVRIHSVSDRDRAYRLAQKIYTEAQHPQGWEAFRKQATAEQDQWCARELYGTLQPELLLLLGRGTRLRVESIGILTGIVASVGYTVLGKIIVEEGLQPSELPWLIAGSEGIIRGVLAGANKELFDLLCRDCWPARPFPPLGVTIDMDLLLRLKSGICFN